MSPEIVRSGFIEAASLWVVTIESVFAGKFSNLAGDTVFKLFFDPQQNKAFVC